MGWSPNEYDGMRWYEMAIAGMKRYKLGCFDMVWDSWGMFGGLYEILGYYWVGM